MLSELLEYFDTIVKEYSIPVPENIQEIYQKLKASKEKSLFTENGLNILEYLQTREVRDTMSSKDIAEAMQISSRSVSGAIRKLVTDLYVEKVGQNPVMYRLTQKGNEFNIENYKESLNKGE